MKLSNRTTILVIFLGLSFLILSINADYGNLCRCLCGSHSVSQLTILVPSDHGCRDCTSVVCKEHFAAECVDAPEIVTHCINRTALMPKVVIGSLFFLCGTLIVVGILIDHYPWIAGILHIDHHKKVHTSLGSDSPEPSSSSVFRFGESNLQQRLSHPSTLTPKSTIPSNSRADMSEEFPSISPSTPYCSTTNSLDSPSLLTSAGVSSVGFPSQINTPSSFAAGSPYTPSNDARRVSPTLI